MDNMWLWIVIGVVLVIALIGIFRSSRNKDAVAQGQGPGEIARGDMDYPPVAEDSIDQSDASDPDARRLLVDEAEREAEPRRGVVYDVDETDSVADRAISAEDEAALRRLDASDDEVAWDSEPLEDRERTGSTAAEPAAFTDIAEDDLVSDAEPTGTTLGQPAPAVVPEDADGEGDLRDYQSEGEDEGVREAAEQSPDTVQPDAERQDATDMAYRPVDNVDDHVPPAAAAADLEAERAEETPVEGADEEPKGYDADDEALLAAEPDDDAGRDEPVEAPAGQLDPSVGEPSEEVEFSAGEEVSRPLEGAPLEGVPAPAEGPAVDAEEQTSAAGVPTAEPADVVAGRDDGGAQRPVASVGERVGIAPVETAQPEGLHAEEPAEGDVRPGEPAEPEAVHAEEPAEGDRVDEVPAAGWDGPFGPGSAEANEDGSGPEGWTVKAARQTKVYLTPDIAVFDQAKANVWFIDEDRAQAAGFRRWDLPGH